MGLLTAIAETRATKQILGHPQDPVLRQFFGGSDMLSGLDINETTALNYSACWAATRILCGIGGMLPLKMYRNLPGGGKEEAKKRDEYWLVHDRPNRYMSSMMYRASRIKFQVNSGNAYSEIERTGAGKILGLWPIHSSRVRVLYEKGILTYEVKNNNGSVVRLDPEDILHFPSPMSEDGICGMGVIAHAAESIGMGLATEKHGAAFFGNGARPGFVVHHPRTMSKEARENFRREWNEIYQGTENSHKIAVMQEGMTISALGVSPEQSQFLETREHNVNEIARWYGVPPHMIGDLRRATFTNIEHQSIEFVVNTLTPWLKIWEQELNYKLLKESERGEFFFEHVFDALLRGDAKGRSEALEVQYRNGVLSIDEWRSIENRNPLPDDLGDQYFVQLNMQTVEQAKKLSEQPLPDTNKPEPPPKEPEETEERSLPLPAPTFTQMPDFMDAHRSALTHALGRLLRKEAQAARRAANKPESFLNWIDEFYAEHERSIATDIEPTLRVVYCVVNPKRDVECEAKRLAAQRTKQARSELLEASGVSPDKFIESVEQVAKRWESTGASELADLEISYLTGG